MMAMTIAPFFKRESSTAFGRRTLSTISAPFSASRGDSGAGGGIVRIEDAGLDAGARLDGDLGAKADHLLDGFGSRGHARLARIGFGSNRNLHESSDGGRPPAISRCRYLRLGSASGNMPSG